MKQEIKLFREYIDLIGSRHGGASPSRIASMADLSSTTITRPYKGDFKYFPSTTTLGAIGKKTGLKWEDFLAYKKGVITHLPGAPSPSASVAEHNNFALVKKYDVVACAGGGAVIHLEEPAGELAFRADWLRGVTQTPIERLAVITVTGDCMEPTLHSGDHVLLDLTYKTPNRNGIYVFRAGDQVEVKRLMYNNQTKKVAIRCDNPLYREDDSDRFLASDVEVIGRVIWLGRRV